MLHPFASRTRICIYVRRKSWQRYNYFAYVVDILLIKLYLREGQGVTGEIPLNADALRGMVRRTQRAPFRRERSERAESPPFTDKLPE